MRAYNVDEIDTLSFLTYPRLGTATLNVLFNILSVLSTEKTLIAIFLASVLCAIIDVLCHISDWICYSGEIWRKRFCLGLSVIKS